MKLVVVLCCVILVVYSKSQSNFGQTRMSNGETEHQKCEGDGTTITECDGSTHSGPKANAENCEVWCNGDADFEFAGSDKAKSSGAVSQSSFSSTKTVNGESQYKKCTGDGKEITECDGSTHPGSRASAETCNVFCDGTPDL
ncbi:unnamed protein product [Bursaphelenchus okinawaensis]|uniref:Uncharacterized protein n=1 Tax=Bursaphelenchus okinawaensis TaxID=465554 RepID=A0A811LG18_9BILA|nr:unnamed protein product [Bursaphelenchus okinawaensis]CAG9121778.1 unnamed protein product [Bursaphelenchus okinawaensis]